MPESPQHRSSGLPHAVGAYFIWGFLPLYLLLVRAVPPFEFVAWRILWTLPFCLLIVAVRKQWGELRAAVTDRATLALLGLSAALIALNWFVYIWAVQSGYVLAASLGYYINPLLNVLLGTLVLRERLSRRQWVAVGFACAGVAVLLTGALTTLWISLALALSFAFYGLVRKGTAVGSLPGLTIETIILLPLASLIVVGFAAGPAGSSFGRDLALDTAIILGGVVTAVPLLLFAIAAKRMDYSTLGFIQFIAPTIVFLLGLTVFDEALRIPQLICFVLIWTASAVFVWDLLTRRKSGRAVTRQAAS
jgi:chloramphenicol-sensitive protein RarD